MSTLIIFSSKNGFTESAAQLLKEQFAEGADLIDIQQCEAVHLSDYDKIVLGSPVYAGKVRNDLITFVEENFAILKGKTIGVFTTGKLEEKQGDALKESFAAEFCSKIGVKGYFGFGANFQRMNFFEKLIMKAMVKIKENTEEFQKSNIQKFAVEMSEL